jgi:hypothetical protein
LRVIRDGLNPDDRVIINGIQRARAGQPVKPVQGSIEPVEPAQVAAGAP